jgi:predicted small lipoprotein YifL
MFHPIKLAVLIVITGAVASCGGKDSPLSAPPAATVNENSDTGTGGTGSSSAPAKNFLDVNRFPINLLISGGVSKDGIPALTRPDFVSPSSNGASYLSDSDMVLGVFINGVAKAYPHNIGWHHEIINDEISGQHIVVTFCPLTGTGLVFDGRGDDEAPIELGVSGLLFNNNLVMYDRRDDTTL